MKQTKANKGILLIGLIVFIMSGIFAVLVQRPVHAQAADMGDTFISSEYQEYCESVGQEFGICPELLEAIIESESSGNPTAVNGNCKGLMQINVPCHRDRMARLGVTDIYNPKDNIRVAADYLLELFEKYQDMGTVLMVYNGSSDAIERGERGAFTEYAAKIMARSWQLERLHGK